MAGWGLVGLAGAALAVLTRRSASRWTLAIACALAGFAYGALLDLYTMVDYGGEQSLDRYLALSARALPFNLAHAAGNFAIALAAGPALVRMISRYRTRLEFNWAPGGDRRARGDRRVAGTSSLTDPAEGGGEAERVGAHGWLRAQNDDGGFAATPGQPSSPAMTGWAMLGLEAAGINPLDVSSGGETPVDYLEENAGRLQSVGDLERTVLALEGAGLDAGVVRGPRPDRPAAKAPRRRRLGRRPGQPDRVLRPRPALGRRPGRRSRQAGEVAARRAEQERRLGNPAAGATGVRLHRSRPPGPRRRRRLGPRARGRRPLPPQGPDRKRGLRDRQQRRRQLAIDRLGDPGHRRGRRRRRTRSTRPAPT